MKKLSLLFVSTVMFFISCTENRSDLLQKINSNETLIRQKFKENIVDSTLMKQLVNQYQTYVDRYPEDSLSPQFLYNASRLLVVLKQPMSAVELLKKFEKKYSSHVLLPEVLFFRGFVEENELRDFQAAKQSYIKFLHKFPNHMYAEQVRLALQYLGVDPQKIIEQFNSSGYNKPIP
ncbi:MAG: hypothetical protein N2Z72_01490 [Bacteroidales bacterium]|nr:hypothetical protein [Bacteroidales bacterium]